MSRKKADSKRDAHDMSIINHLDRMINTKLGIAMIRVALYRRDNGMQDESDVLVMLRPDNYHEQIIPDLHWDVFRDKKSFREYFESYQTTDPMFGPDGVYSRMRLVSCYPFTGDFGDDGRKPAELRRI